MIRIFSILSSVVIIMILISAGGVYWISKSNVDQAKFESKEAIAKGMAQAISAQVVILQNSVDNMAASAEAIEAVESNDLLQMSQAASRLESFLPGVMKIRLLPADVQELDETSIPHMGNADLVLVQETLLKKQSPFVQGQGKNRHLAIAAAIKKEGVVIGVILASLEFEILQSNLNKFKVAEDYYELKQKNVSLANAGNANAKNEANNFISVAQTAWAVYYWPANNNSLASLSLLAALVLGAIVVSGLVCFLSYRKLSAVLKQDQNSIFNVVKQLMEGKTVGSHPVQLPELKNIISMIIQFKRVLDRGDDDPSKNEVDSLDEKNDDDFFDGIQDVSFLGASITLENDEANTTQVADEVSTQAVSPIYRMCDIRGIAGKALSEQVVFDIGRAVGSEAKEKELKNIVIGRDGRTSSPILAESFAKGVVSTGTNVLDIGLVPTPVVYFVAHHSEEKSGVVITGSHNPAEYNGLKIIINGESISGDRIKQIEQRINSENYAKAASAGTVEQNKMFNNEYIGTISEDIHLGRPMKVVIDCGNGAAGEIAPLLFKTLGCEVVELFCDIDGKFPNHHPDPSKPENMTDLMTAVRHYEADVGIAFDGDGDRLGVVDDKGKIIWPDRLLMLFAKEILASKPGAEIIFDVKCSNHLGEQIIKNGGRPLMYKTGHSLIKAKLKETGAVLAGEQAGHIFFNDRWPGFDDALYAGSRLIEILSADSRCSSDVFSDFPDSVNTPELSVKLAEGKSISYMKKIIANAAFQDGNIKKIDGMRAEFQDGWGLVRASNTMPALVFRFEADNVTALKRIQLQFKDLLKKVDSDLDIPF